MRRLTAVPMLVVFVVLLAAPVEAQVCNMSGSWSTIIGLWTIRDDGAGNLTGIVPSGPNPTAASVLTGTRTGADVFVSAGLINVTGTLNATCDVFTMGGMQFSRTSQSYCGDAVIDAGEACDDGNFVNGDVCTVLCTAAACGNWVVEAGEQCDDGNLTNGDGCSAGCEPNVCGNTVIEPGEACDDGNLINGDGCSTTCQVNVCGNGTLESGETCDDGNVDPGDDCSATCQYLGCSVTGTWTSSFAIPLVWRLREDVTGAITGTLQLGASGPTSLWNLSGNRTAAAVTGLMFLGNATMLSCDEIVASGGGVPSLQRLSHTYCGDGTVDADEACDDGNFVNGDACTALCTPAACGNGILEPAELCDDANVTNGDGCSDSCLPNLCGNGIQESGEQCDDSNLVPGDGCSLTCQINVCGNGVVESGEQCDDGNLDPDDTCSTTCQFLGCDVTGVWSVNGPGGQYVAYLTEDAGGVISGVTYAIGATMSTPASGTRVGATLTLSGGFLLSTTLTSCDTMGGSAPWARMTGSFCGDGVTDAGEQCDDGNLLAGDDCNAICSLPGCGNGLPDPLEQCDDGNASDNDGCKSNCTLNVCGDGILHTAVEECDAGTANSFDPDALCRPTCRLPRCADGVTDPGRGEQCDDANVAIADGCDGQCLTETVITATLPPGGSATTDGGSTGATPEAPVQTAVTSPNSGSVTLVVTSVVPTSQPGYQLLGKQVNIIAPPATVATPLRFVFELDATAIPIGHDETTLVMFRNGVAVVDCPGSARALPSGPCITDRERLADGDVRLTVLTAAASTWTMGVLEPERLAGSKLLLKTGDTAAKRALVLQSRDAALPFGTGNGSADDPVLHGASVRVRTADGCGGPCDHAYGLPASGWSYVGAPGANRGYKYKDARLLLGPIKSASLKAGRLLKLSGKGAGLGHALAEEPSPVVVNVRVGGRTACMVFGGTTKFVASKSHSAKNAPAGDCS